MRLHRALAALPADPAVRLVPIECLGVCRRPCTVAFSAPGKWTYVYADVDPAAGAADVLAAAGRFAASADGMVPWRERPASLRQGLIARVPPALAKVSS
jgi:predicted metal-binding protein